jgi:branched-chain amino acid transport system permease protein
MGLSLVIEMTFRLMAKASDGSAMSFLYVPIDAARPLPWLVAATLLVGGFWLSRRSWTLVANAWNNATAAAAGGRV